MTAAMRRPGSARISARGLRGRTRGAGCLRRCAGGAEALLGRRTFEGLAAHDPRDELQRRRFEATRRESANDNAPEHAAGLRLTARY